MRKISVNTSWFKQFNRHLKGRGSEPILLLITILIFTSFIFASLMLSLSLDVFQKGIDDLEDELESIVSFDGATIHLFNHLRIYKTTIKTRAPLENRTRVGFDMVEIGLNYKTVLNMLRNEYDLDEQKLSPRSIIVSSIWYVEALSLSSTINTTEDKKFLETFPKFLFENEVLPYEAQFRILKPNINIATRGLQLELATPIFELATQKGQLAFDSSLKFTIDTILRTNLQGTMSVDFKSSKSFERFSLFIQPDSFIISNTSLLSESLPLILPSLQVEKSGSTFTMGTAKQSNLASYDGTDFFLTIPPTNFFLKDYIENIEESNFSMFKDDVLTLASSIFYNIPSGRSNYGFSFSSDSEPNQLVNISLKGDNKEITFFPLFLKTSIFEFVYSGTVDILNRGIKGRLSLEKLQEKPSKLLAVANQVDSTTTIDFTNIIVGGEDYSPFRIEFDSSSSTKFRVEIIDLVRDSYKSLLVADGTYDSFNEFSFNLRLFNFPSYVALLFVSNQKIVDVFDISKSTFNGSAAITLKPRSKINIDYDLFLRALTKTFTSVSNNAMGLEVQSTGTLSVGNTWDNSLRTKFYSSYDTLQNTEEFFQISMDSSFTKQESKWTSIRDSFIVLQGPGFDEYKQALRLFYQKNERFEFEMGQVFTLRSELDTKFPKIEARAKNFPLLPYDSSLSMALSLDFSPSGISNTTVSASVVGGSFPQMKTDFKYRDGLGSVSFSSISNGVLPQNLPQLLQNTIEVEGKLLYDNEKELLNWDLYSPSEAGLFKRIEGEYDFKQNKTVLDFEGLNAADFAQTIKGKLNGALSYSGAEEKLYLRLDRSLVTVNNITFNMETELEGNNDELFVSSLAISNDDFSLFSEKTNIIESRLESRLSFSHSSLSHLQFLIDTTVSGANLRLACIVSFACLSDEDFTLVVHVGAQNTSEFPLTSQDSISNKGLRFKIVANDGSYEFSEELQGLYLFLSNELLDGYVDKSDFISSSVSGTVREGEVRVQTKINSLNFNNLRTYFELPETSGIDLSSAELSGQFFLRNTLAKPLFWGSLVLDDFGIDLDMIGGKVKVESMQIFLSESNINVSNTQAQFGDSPIALSLVGRLENYSLDYLKFYLSSYPNQPIYVQDLLLGNTRISGEIDATISLEVLTDEFNISSRVKVSNADISFDAFQIEDSAFSNFDINSSMNINFGNGVQVLWPTRNFPVLKGLIGPGQNLFVSYSARDDITTSSGSLSLTGGNFYYFDKSFSLREAEVDFTNPYSFKKPFVHKMVAEKKERYKGQALTLTMQAQNEYLTELQPVFTSDPLLTPDEISMFIGAAFANNNETLPEATSTNPILPVLSLGNPIANIGVFSRFGDALKNTLRLDYVSIQSDIVQNLIEYSLTQTPTGVQFELEENIFGTIFDNSSIEFGKYFDSIYVSLLLQLDTVTPFTNVYTSNIINKVDISTALNVDIPTPVFDISWTFDSNFKTQYDQLLVTPLSYLSISYTQRY